MSYSKYSSLEEELTRKGWKGNFKTAKLHLLLLMVAVVLWLECRQHNTINQSINLATTSTLKLRNAFFGRRLHTYLHIYIHTYIHTYIKYF